MTSSLSKKMEPINMPGGQWKWFPSVFTGLQMRSDRAAWLPDCITMVRRAWRKERAALAALAAAGGRPLSCGSQEGQPGRKATKARGRPQRLGLPTCSPCTAFFSVYPSLLSCLCLCLSPRTPPPHPHIHPLAISRKTLFCCWQSICNKRMIEDLDAEAERRGLLTAGVLGSTPVRMEMRKSWESLGAEQFRRRKRKSF